MSQLHDRVTLEGNRDGSLRMELERRLFTMHAELTRRDQDLQNMRRKPPKQRMQPNVCRRGYRGARRAQLARRRSKI
eukprot:5692592-Amphidinium_carterae.1